MSDNKNVVIFKKLKIWCSVSTDNMSGHSPQILLSLTMSQESQLVLD